MAKDGNGNRIHGVGLQKSLSDSIENSLRLLNREALDIVQIHNATVEVVKDRAITEGLLNAKRQGKIRFLGASVYSETEALTVIEDGHFDLLQIAYNVLDQRMTHKTLPAAQRLGIGIIARSVFLKGVLTEKAQWLPPDLTGLKSAAEKVRDVLSVSWQTLPHMALRFCLSDPQVSTVLVGIRTDEELKQALNAAASGPLSEELSSRTPGLALTDERLLNPSYWPVA